VKGRIESNWWLCSFNSQCFVPGCADFGGFLYVGKYRSVSLSAALPDSDANFIRLLFESHLISLSQLALVDTVQSGQLFVSCSETLAFRYGEPIRVVATIGILVRV